MKKNIIIKNLKKVDRNTQIVKIFDKFCKTKRAKQLVIDVERLGIYDLLHKYQIGYLRKIRPNNSPSAIRAFIRYHLKKNNIFKDYTRISNGRFIPRKDINYKLPWNLTKEEIKSIWKNRSTKLGYAERLHMLEEHKMNKWEAKHKPTFEELKQDLFPKTLIQGFLDLRDKKREILRENLSVIYPPKENCIITIRYYSDNGTTINEKIFGHLYDPKHIIDSRPSFYTIQNKSKILKDIAVKFKNKAINIYGDDFICLKVFCHNSEDVGMWI